MLVVIFIFHWYFDHYSDQPKHTTNFPDWQFVSINIALFLHPDRMAFVQEMLVQINSVLDDLSGTFHARLEKNISHKAAVIVSAGFMRFQNDR